MEAFTKIIWDQLQHFGPMDIGHFMQAANNHYYATRDPLGTDGDFTTAPEISQLFGEMIGAALADTWLRTGSPACTLVELGPGRGTLMADILRATAGVSGFHDAMNIALVETSPTLRDKQREKLAAHHHVVWHDSISTLPDDRPMMIIANEFFDALPIRQAVMTDKGWMERVIGMDGHGNLVFGLSVLPPTLAPRTTPAIDSIMEFSPIRDELFEALCFRLQSQGGMMLVIDYGHEQPGAVGDTLQAVYKHEYCPVLERIGEADLTSHVDFARLKELAIDAGCPVHGSVTQGQFLRSLGIELRLATLEQKNPGIDLRSGVNRLMDKNEMGGLFRVLAVTDGRFPSPPGL